MIRRLLVRLVYRIVDGVVARTLPIILKHYYGVYSQRWHPHYALRETALADTLAYIREHMSSAMIKDDEYGVLTYAGRHVTLDGLFLEFGVRTGSTINHIAAQHPDRRVYGFDSFEGLPEEWSGWIQEKGVFSMNVTPKVNPNVELVIGRFEKSLPEFLAHNSDDAAFIHIDSDLYASAETVLTHLAPRIRPNTIIVFNEYFNYPNWQQHEFRAFQEFCNRNSVSYDYLCWGQFEVAVRIREIATVGTHSP